jgi:hypothetical protein
MSGKQMEGDNSQRRKKAREARDQGRQASEEGATLGASKQRQNVSDTDHRDRIETIRQGKQKVIRENTPEPRPGYGEDQGGE